MGVSSGGCGGCGGAQGLGSRVIAHGNRHYRVLSVIPVERLSEFVDQPAGGVLEVEPL